MRKNRLFIFLSLMVVMGLSPSCKEAEFDTSILENQSHSVVKLVTNKGAVFIELYNNDAPISVDNFLSYVRSDFYDETIFHRVIDGFMIQGGGFTVDMIQKRTESPIKNEAINGVSNKRGTVAMARTQIVDSATSQFFINVNDNSFLDHSSLNPQEYGYAVFGNVIQGMEIIDIIKALPTQLKKPYNDVPKEPVIIQDIIIIQ